MAKRAYVPPKSDRLNMILDIKKFGPISDGRLHLKPLTILIGPNNSGKSYAAMLVHSIFRSENYLIFPHYSRGYNFIRHFINLMGSSNSHIQKILKANPKKKEFFMPVPLVKKITKEIKIIHKQNVEQEIIRNFGSTIKDLITLNEHSSKIDILSVPKTTISLGEKFSVKHDFKTNFKYKIKLSSKMEHTTKKIGDTIVINVYNGYGKYRKDEISRIITELFLYDISRKIIHHIPSRSYYFPASRSGILQAHKLLSATIVQHAPSVGIESFNISKLTGTIADFISNIIEIDNTKGQFYKTAIQLEREIIHGTIQVQNSEINKFPEIMYDLENSLIPLHRTSSTISEIAPISLYLKHIIEPGSMLIIEEPEAHLSPMNQIIFAKHIVKMIRSGLNVLITTHSEKLFKELGRYVAVGTLSPNDRKRAGFDKLDYLTRDEVSPHRFENVEGIHHTIKKIKMDSYAGIAQDEFIKIDEFMYEQNIQLQEILGKNRDTA